MSATRTQSIDEKIFLITQAASALRLLKGEDTRDILAAIATLRRQVSGTQATQATKTKTRATHVSQVQASEDHAIPAAHRKTKTLTTATQATATETPKTHAAPAILTVRAPKTKVPKTPKAINDTVPTVRAAPTNDTVPSAKHTTEAAPERKAREEVPEASWDEILNSGVVTLLELPEDEVRNRRIKETQAQMREALEVNNVTYRVVSAVRTEANAADLDLIHAVTPIHSRYYPQVFLGDHKTTGFRFAGLGHRLLKSY